MKEYKRFFSLMLALCIVLEILPVVARAADITIQMETQTISSDADTSGAITATGSLYMWGWNDYGAVGNGTTEEQLIPVKVLDNVASFSTFNGRTAAITKDGTLYMWGWNSANQIGNGANSSQLTPLKIMDNVVSISMGMSHNAALTATGELYMWGGNNLFGELGTGTNTDYGIPVKVLDHITSVELGSGVSAAVTSTGELYTWGWNTHGTIGNRTKEDQLVPLKIMDNVSKIAVKDHRIAAIQDNGTLFMWGDIGDTLGTGEDQTTPLKVMENVTSVSLGNESNLNRAGFAAITRNGDLYMCGDYAGDGTTTQYTSPKKIMSNVASVSFDMLQTMAVTTSGELYAWGPNNTGQVGNGSTDKILVPTKILDNVAYIQAGLRSLALTVDGEFYIWGPNSRGTVGNGSETGRQLVPYLVLDNVALPSAIELPNLGPDIPPEPFEMASITALYPSNGSTFDHAATSGDAAFHITFDREVPNTQGGRPGLDFSVGTLEVHRASDDAVVYAVTESPFTAGTSSYVSLYGSNSPFTAISIDNITPELDYDTEYYVTMPKGFVKLADGAVSPAIEKGDWAFRTTEKQIEAPETPMPITGPFWHNSTLTGKTEKYEYTYDDKWFFTSSYEYQHDLTKMSLCMAMAAYGADHTGSGRNIKATMDGLYFENCVIEYPTPEYDSIGYAIGTRTITSESGEKASLVLVAVRGGGYGVEWGGDFRVGYGKTHEGFALASKQVVAGIEKYFAQYGGTLLPDYKIWVVGYSRGAATANLVAKELDDGAVKGVNTKLNSIFAFCFECPQNTREDVSDTKYYNIINIANPIDFVPKVAMSRWNYSRYGRTLFLPYQEGNGENYWPLREEMSKSYYKLAGDNNRDAVSRALVETYGQATVLDTFMHNLAGIFISPQVYTTLNQAALINLAADTLGGEDRSWDTALSVWITSPPLVAQAVRYPYNTDQFIWVAGTGAFEKAHYAELCLAWLNALNGDLGAFDDPYTSILSHFGHQRYREVFINCPVDVVVYNSTNQIVAKIVNDSVQEIDNGLVAYIDGDSQKVIALPVDGEYTIEITATDNGTVTYVATEYNLNRSTTEKVISYYEVSVVENDTLVGLIENLVEVPSARYPLYLNDSDESLIPSVDQSDDTVQEFSVEVLRSGNGAVAGGGNYVSGEFAKVTATANSGETFLGWYVNNTLVSSDAEYRFLVDKNVSITAKFTQNTTTPDAPINPGHSSPSSGSTGGSSASTTYGIIIPTVTGGSVTATPTSASKGSTVTLTATPNEGFELASLAVTDSKGNELELTDKGNGKYTFVMPNSKVTVAAVFQPIQSQDESQSPQNTPWINPFTDVAESAWYYDAVKFVSENSLMNGIGNNLFAPDANLSRAQLAQLLYNKERKPAVSSISPFSDVDAGAWYADAVIWAAEKDIVGGYGNGLFGPDDNITREQLAVMLWRYAGEPTASADLTFSDADRISGFAQSAIRWAVENKILNGKGGNVLDPTGFATRAEVAQMFKNYLG